jgi:hypothetical protein
MSTLFQAAHASAALQTSLTCLMGTFPAMHAAAAAAADADAATFTSWEYGYTDS